MFIQSSFSRISLALALGLALAACSSDSADSKADKGGSDKAETSQTSSSSSSSNSIDASSRKLFGGAEPTSVSESPIKGLMEVHVNGNVFYASPDGKYFMQGDMIEVATMKSLTEEARTSNRPDVIKDVDVSDSITYEAKNEKYEVYVFTDVTCPYCTKFHEEIDAYNKAGITVHYFAWPRSGPDSEVATDMASAWCAKDQKKAINALFAHEDIKAVSCDDPVSEHFELGRNLMVSGTPAIFTPDGRQHGGYVSASDLLSSLEATQGE